MRANSLEISCHVFISISSQKNSVTYINSMDLKCLVLSFNECWNYSGLLRGEIIMFPVLEYIL